MTIFLMVLKKLIKEQLSPVSNNLSNQAKSYAHNKDLSLDQKEVIDKLEESVLGVQGSGNDDEDSKRIYKLIDDAHKKIQNIRESHGEQRDSGATIKCLINLMFHTSGFYTKLAEFKFNLLKMDYSETPQNVIYYHAIYYFGEEIFNPLSGIDVRLRAKKEDKLAMRLQSLSELIKPTHTLEEQKERCNQILLDLAADNKMVIKNDDASKNVTLPVLSFWGFQVSAPISDWFSASEGRMGQQFNLAHRKIKEMTVETFEPPILPEAHEKLANVM